MDQLSERVLAGLPRFDFVDLRLLCFVAQSGSLTLAAEQACLSLPAASMRIKQLENSLGLTLLHRRTRGTTLTSAGRTFIEHARTVLRAAGEMSESMAQLAGGQRGRVVVWANTTAFRDFIPRELPDFLVEHPDVDIELREHTSPEIVNALRDAVVDVGILSSSFDTTGLRSIPYRLDEIVICVGLTHALSSMRSITFADCLHYDFVGLSATNPLQSFVLSNAVNAGHAMRLRVEVASFDDLASLVKAGIGIAIFPLSIAKSLGGVVRILPLNDAWAVQELKICWSEKHEISAAAFELINHLNERSLSTENPIPEGAGERLPYFNERS
ncbi:LysR family transcriptional regulator [Candidimonas nitroreducens]|uniref:LysR family transcriptional regulator n=1 Tax=Candidimonas nitroreducens TaxID=683354 RepID=A0A225M7S1_9BURK|nr:LysR family transcriptional regulator [Candidimonas nitroreducens]OWT57385.1 LysR family transcriptional regulator [Candidimonas nitroreducens]